VGASADVLGNAENLGRDPVEKGDGRRSSGGDVPRLAAGGRDEVDVAAGRTLIAHQAADEGDLFAVGRPAGDGDLEIVELAGDLGGVEDRLWRWRRLRGGGWLDCLYIEMGHPPVVFAGRIGGDVGHLSGVGRPVELVDVQVGRGDLPERSGGDAGHSDALDLRALFADDTAPGLHGGERAGGAGGVLDEEEGERAAVGRPGGHVDLAGDVGELAALTGLAGPKEDLLLVGVVFTGGAGGRVGQPLAVGRPGGAVIGAVGCLGFGVDGGLFCGIVYVGEAELGAIAGFERPGNGFAVGREGGLADMFRLPDALDYGADARVLMGRGVRRLGRERVEGREREDQDDGRKTQRETGAIHAKRLARTI